jgi:hypothetical protein
MFEKLTKSSLLMHAFFVTLFLIIPTLAFVRPPGESFFALTRVFVQDTTANFVLLCFFYLNYYVLLPRLFFTRRYVVYALCVFAFLAIALMLPYATGKVAAMGGPNWPQPHSLPGYPPVHVAHPPSLATFVFDEFRRHLYLFFSALFFSFLLRTREHMALLKEEKLQVELSSLKSQINPHFLFNTLNSIYALAVKKDDKVPDAIINLSGLMRYVIKDANDYKIPLKNEIEYLTNYIELQKARLGETGKVQFNCSGRAGAATIAPLILITYIENAFKYGINPDVEDGVVDIAVQITDDAVQLYVFNKKVPRSAAFLSTGIGLSNTAERLKHLYPGKHQLQITENKETYSVTLTIKLV